MMDKKILDKKINTLLRSWKPDFFGMHSTIGQAYIAGSFIATYDICVHHINVFMDIDNKNFYDYLNQWVVDNVK
jgi:hypothetical protein